MEEKPNELLLTKEDLQAIIELEDNPGFIALRKFLDSTIYDVQKQSEEVVPVTGQSTDYFMFNLGRLKTTLIQLKNFKKMPQTAKEELEKRKQIEKGEKLKVAKGEK